MLLQVPYIAIGRRVMLQEGYREALGGQNDGFRYDKVDGG